MRHLLFSIIAEAPLSEVVARVTRVIRLVLGMVGSSCPEPTIGIQAIISARPPSRTDGLGQGLPGSTSSVLMDKGGERVVASTPSISTSRTHISCT